MMRESIVFAAAALMTPLLCLRADDGQAQEAKNPQSASGASETPKPDKARDPSPEQIREILRDAFKLMQSREEQDPKADPDTPRDPFAPGELQLQVDAAKAIGRAQAKLGDLAAARASWQFALDIIQGITSYSGPADRARLQVEIADAQTVAGEHSEARFTLRQALQAARSIKAESPDPFLIYLSGAQVNPLKPKAGLLERIARCQRTLGDTADGERTFQLAHEVANAIKEDLVKVDVLVDLAKGGPPEKVKPTWKEALDFALGIKDEYARGKAVEIVLRGRIKAGLVDEALATLSDRLTGDLRNFGIWAVGDAVASSDERIAPAAMAALSQLAMKAEFDRPSRKISVFKRIAEAQARLGDYDGAYRTAGEPHPVNEIQTFSATHARINVMKAVAEAQLKAGEPAAARETVLAALELIGDLPDEDAESYFPLQELGSIQARSGDTAGALQTSQSVSSVEWRVFILTQVAEAHAQAGRRDLALKAIDRARDDARRAPNSALWSRVTSYRASSASDLTDNAEPMVPVLQSIATAQARMGELSSALKTVAEMGDSATAINVRTTVLAEAARIRLKAGDSKGAREAAEFIVETDEVTGERDQLLEQIANRQTKDGGAKEVLAWAGNEKSPGARLHVLRGLAEAVFERAAANLKQPVDSPSHSASPRP